MARYSAFISYSHADEEVASWLHRGLESYRIPKRVMAAHGLRARRLTPIFRDREELATSSNLTESIQQALVNSDALIVICSASAAASRWVNAEIEAFRASGEGPVLCVIVKDEAAPVGDCFPPSLQAESIEPLAADLANDGKRGTRLKVVAGLLGIGLDELVQRETQQRIRRLTLTAAASAVAMALAVGLASYAFLAERRAATAQVQAELEEQRASDVTDFLLEMFEAANPADTRGADITARELLARGASEINASKMDPDARVRIDHALGQAYLKLQLLEDAAMHLRSAEASLDNGEDEELAIEVETDLANLLLYQREFAQADDAMSELLGRATIAFGSRDKRTYALMANLATARLYQGNAASAEELLTAAHEGLYELLGPSDGDTMGTLAILAVVYARTGRIDEAIEVQEEVIRLQRDNLGEDHPQTIDSVDNLATFYMRNEDWMRAVQIGQEGLALNIRVYGADSPAVAHVQMNLTYALIELGDLAAAESHGRAAVSLAGKHFGENHPVALLAVENLAAALYMLGESDESTKMMSAVITRLQDTVGDADSRTIRAVVASAEMPYLAGDEAEASVRLEYVAWESAMAETWLELRAEFDTGYAQFVDAKIAAAY